MLLRLLSLILTVLILQIYAIECPPEFDFDSTKSVIW